MKFNNFFFKWYCILCVYLTATIMFLLHWVYSQNLRNFEKLLMWHTNELHICMYVGLLQYRENDVRCFECFPNRNEQQRNYIENIFRKIKSFVYNRIAKKVLHISIYIHIYKSIFCHKPNGKEMFALVKYNLILIK